MAAGKRYELIYFDELGEIQRIPIGNMGKNRLTIGRDSMRCDLVFLPMMVSHVHGCLHLSQDGVYYEDLNSTNGTVIRENANETKLFHTGRKVRLTNNSFLYVNGAKGTFCFFVRQIFPEEGWKKVAVGNKPLTIGRAGKNDIIFKHPAVSKEHARITCEGKELFLTDCKSFNGTRVNGHLISGKVKLSDYDVVQILDFQIIVSQGILYYCTKVEGVHLVVNDLCKTVNKGKKVLLNHVDLEIKSNDFIAIIGGSGAGKTTLMNAISGFDRECTGQIYFNGMDLRKEFDNLKDMIGYVPQQEIIYENLTLHNMLYYTAKMKMPKDTDKAEIERMIKEVLSMVELTEHQKTYIRKLSGGQKKRASIAVELLADPKLFFLDEPTSGLDPGTEKNLMMMLNRLSKTRDKTTVIVTHTTQNLHLCDKVVFMGPGGYLCFYGSVEQAKMFFQTDDLVDIYNIIAQNPRMWAEQFANCMREEKVQNPDNPNERGKIRKRPVSPLRQAGVLMKRYFELIWNDKVRLAILMVQPVIIALLLKLVSDEDIYDIFESTQSMMFALSCSAIWIGLFNSIQEICKERTILKREYMACLKLPLYTLSKYVVQTLLAAVQALLLSGIFILMVDKNVEGILFDSFFFEIFLTIWITILASMSIGFIISALVKSGDKAMTLAPFVLIVQLLFSGILFSLEGSSEIVSYVTVSKWSVEALGSIVNLNDLDLRMMRQVPGLEHEAQEIYEHTVGHLCMDWGIMLGMMLICAVVTCVLLINVKNDSR